MQIIIYTRPDGGVSIVRPQISQDDPPGFTLAQALQRSLAKDIPLTATNVQTINDSALPTDRSKRNAWRQSGAAVIVDAAAAATLDAQIARLSTDESERVSCKQDASVMSLINQTKAEWISWVTANFPSITTAGERTRLGTLFWVVAIAVRRLVRNGGS